MKSVKFEFHFIDVICIVLAIILLTIFTIIQHDNFGAMFRDNTRKTAINSMYYALKNSYYKTHQYYPEQIDEDILSVVAPELWTDPSGHHLGAYDSDYTYIPGDCTEGRCQEFVLISRLEKEDAFVKTNQDEN